jgi:hypothetical protein
MYSANRAYLAVLNAECPRHVREKRKLALNRICRAEVHIGEDVQLALKQGRVPIGQYELTKYKAPLLFILRRAVSDNERYQLAARAGPRRNVNDTWLERQWRSVTAFSRSTLVRSNTYLLASVPTMARI